MITAFVHSQPFEHYGNSMCLYYYCRALDIKGVGKVVIHRDAFLEDTGISRATFYRYLKDTRLFRHSELIKDSDGDYLIYYNSLKRICAEADIRDLGAIIELEPSQFKLWRQFLTLAQALELQEQSRFMAELHASFRQEKTNFINIDELFEISAECHNSSLPSNSWCGDPLLGQPGALITEWRVFFDTQQFTPFGGSLEGIAKRIGRTVRTACRRLKEFPKIHQCITRPHYQNHYSFKFIDDADIQSEVRHFFKKKALGNFPQDTVFRSYTNLYLPCIDTFHHRKIRQRVKSFVCKFLGEDLSWSGIRKTTRGYKDTPSYSSTFYTQENPLG